MVTARRHAEGVITNGMEVSQVLLHNQTIHCYAEALLLEPPHESGKEESSVQGEGYEEIRIPSHLEETEVKP